MSAEVSPAMETLKVPNLKRDRPVIIIPPCPYQKFHLNRNLKQHELTLNWGEK